MRSIWVDAQVLATILDLFRLMVFGRTDFLRLEHCDLGTVEISETSTLCVETGQMLMLVLATKELSAAEKRQVSSAETG